MYILPLIWLVLHLTYLGIPCFETPLRECNLHGLQLPRGVYCKLKVGGALVQIALGLNKGFGIPSKRKCLVVLYAQKKYLWR